MRELTMSIYCTTFDMGGEHTGQCARVKRVGRKVYEQDDSKPCTCGSAPIRYQGSHILPSDSDERNGIVRLGAIPPHITRNGRYNRRGDRWHRWLRLSVEADAGATVVLTKKQAMALRDALNDWLKQT